MNKPETAAYAAEKTVTLTPREREILDMLLGGSTPKEIAFNLKISYGTVLNHQNNIYQKLGVHNINELFVKFRPAADIPPPREMKGIFLKWYKFGDKYSTFNVTVTNEEINGQTEECVIMSGTRSDYTEAHSGAHGISDETTLRALKTMKSLSFKAIGDGNEYSVCFVTVEGIDGDGWIYTFPTVRDEIITVTVNVPDDLIRIGWSGKKIEFIQNNFVYLQIQTVNPGPYDFKFWDIRIYQNS